jgi:hypothetical protein
MKVAISPLPIRVVNRTWPLSRFVNRHLRWTQLRRRINPVAWLIEPIGYPVAWMLALLAAAMAAPSGTASSAAAFALWGIVTKCASDELLARRLRGRGFGLANLAWIPVKDVVALALWLAGGFKRRVEWRGNELWIGPDSVLEERPGRPAPVEPVPWTSLG